MNEATKPFLVTEGGDQTRLQAQDNLVARNIPAQRAFLQEAIKAAKGLVVLDLARVEMMDSMGISLLVRLFKSCQERGLGFRVEGANSEILRLSRFFSLSDLFEMQGS
jgi:anti-anti-sigma factor